MNIFILAQKQLERENLADAPNAGSLLIDRAVKIREHLDISDAQRERAEKGWIKRKDNNE